MLFFNFALICAMIKIEKIPLEKANTPKIICDYLSQKESLKPFYHLFPAPENFEKQIALKKNKLHCKRNLLRKALEKQYQKIHHKITLHKTVQKNIALLSQENTWTITTGHQLNLFTGPLYFIYKIVTTINLTMDLKKRYPKENFIPVYWMASEDHDFKEINHFYFKEQKITWDIKTKGAVGQIPTREMEHFFQAFKQCFNRSVHSNFLINLFEKSYLKTKNLSQATQVLVHQLFGAYGLLIVDAHEKTLKKHFSGIMEKELKEQTGYSATQKTNALLKKNYRLQLHPRPINLFYLKDFLRERIILTKNGQYQVGNTSLIFSQAEILEELKKYPERFSPNVLLRPVYQEFILPNLAYVGGGNELAYWLQLKNLFDDLDIVFPILHIRNSALLVSDKQHKKISRLHTSFEKLFLDEQELIKNYMQKNAQKITFEKEKQLLKTSFENVISQIIQIDFSLKATFEAAAKKQQNSWARLEKKMYKALKTKHKNEIERLLKLKRELFPNQNLQERVENFSRFYMELGQDFIPSLLVQMNPWEFGCDVFKCL